ncbi:hypothetical protein DPMN_186194 [Dreissena polymorpha]|uniref:Neurotransmitter-gated ion-channel ligand-binding domain-containing protein n=1 Tax=Dreissena polymorpha TaxID=45954 RepID=A0A9D4DLW5_DREPO|nr:hypothetical protein DPMN_186194 [Dreissena polymorpha]
MRHLTALQRYFFSHYGLQVDVTFYPYDQQKCAIVVIGWGYTVEEVDLAFLSQAFNTDDLE